MEVKPKRMTALILMSVAMLSACASRNAEILDKYTTYQVREAGSDAAMTVTFMGTTTLLFRDRNHAVLIDGFFSRPGKLRVVIGSIEPNEKKIRAALTSAAIEQLDAIYVAHSHYDHAMDVAVVAEITGAQVYGSESTINIAKGGGLPDGRASPPPKNNRYGDFSVRTFSSLHSPKPRYQGVISSPLRPPVRVSAYKEGDSYSFLISHRGQRFLVHPSANYLKGMYDDVKADVVFLGIGALGKQSDAFIDAYWNEVVIKTGASLVMPVHWDDFTTPVDSSMRLAPRLFDDVERSMENLNKLAGRKVRLANPPVIKPMDLCRNLSCGQGMSNSPLQTPVNQ